jgi:tetratricopeptide (TPR) repeat protein
MLSARIADVEETHVERSMSEADSLYRAGNPDDAAALYERVLLWDPDNAAAAKGLCVAKYRQALSLAEKSAANESWVEGLFYSNRALSYAPEDSAASSLAAACNERIKAAEDNRALLSELVKTSVDLYAERRFGEALSGFEEALKIDPETPLAREYADKCRAAIGDAVRRARSDAASRAKRTDYDGAVLALEAVLEYDGPDAAIRREIDAYKAKRHEAERATAAAAAASETLAVTETAPPRTSDKMLDQQYRAGIEAFNAGDFEGATGHFLKIWTVQPDYTNVSELLTKAYLFVGMGYYSDGKYAEAIEAWQKALTVDPDNSKAKRYLSKAHEEMQKLSGVYNGR